MISCPSPGKVTKLVKSQKVWENTNLITKFSAPHCSVIPTCATWGFAAWLLPLEVWSIGTVYLTNCSMIQIIVAINHRAILNIAHVGVWNSQWRLFCSQLSVSNVVAGVSVPESQSAGKCIGSHGGLTTWECDAARPLQLWSFFRMKRWWYIENLAKV